jgi:hypothetical protein
MPGRGAALEDLDDDHASAAAWTRAREGGRLVAIIIIGSIALGLLATEQLAGACDVVGAGGLGEQAVVADAVQALGQDVNEEAVAPGKWVCDHRERRRLAGRRSGDRPCSRRDDRSALAMPKGRQIAPAGPKRRP